MLFWTEVHWRRTRVWAYGGFALVSSGWQFAVTEECGNLSAGCISWEEGESSSFVTSWLHFILFHLFIFLINLFIYLYLAVLGLRCCVQAFSSCGEWGATLRCSARASYCHGFCCCRAPALGARASVVVARRLWSAGSVVVAHGLSCSTACGIFPDQGSNLCPLHWQADS